MKAGGRLHVVSPSVTCDRAAADHLARSEHRRLDDHFHQRLPRASDYGGNVGRDLHPVAGLHQPERHHHVQLSGPCPDGTLRLISFGLGFVGAEGKADHRRQLHAAPAQSLGASRDPYRVHADGSEAMLECLVTERVDVGGRRLGLEERMVDEVGDARVLGREGHAARRDGRGVA